MAFKGNSSDQRFFQDIKLYTGPSLMKVIGICPNLGELQLLGFNFEKEPEYVDTKGEFPKVRIDVIFKNKDLKAKAGFFLEKRNRTNKDGNKFEIINNFGQSTWTTTVEEAINKVGKNGNKWFKPNGARVAMVGEVQLMGFLRDWMNIGPEEESTIDNYDAIFKGNFKELQQYVKQAENNTIYTLCTVKDNKYQQVYTGFFARSQFSISTVMRKLMAYVEDQKKAGYPLKDAYSYEFKEFTPSVVIPDPEPKGNNEPDF